MFAFMFTMATVQILKGDRAINIQWGQGLCYQYVVVRLLMFMEFICCVRLNPPFHSIVQPFFIQLNVSYVVTYNSRSRQFIVLDSKGITAWSHNSVINSGTKLCIFLE